MYMRSIYLFIHGQAIGGQAIYTLKHFTKSSICLFYSWVFASSPVGIAGNQHQHIKQLNELKLEYTCLPVAAMRYNTW